jgi:sugar phosphate isomerase/epimerase
MTLSRRSFLGSSILGVAAPALLGGQALAIDPIARTRPSHLKLSIAAYSYRQYLQGEKKSMDLFDFAGLAADMGLDAIEPTSYYFPADAPMDYFSRLQRHAFLLGLDISGTAIGNNFCLPPGPERDKTLKLTRDWIDRAAAMQAPVIRIFAGNVPKGDTEAAAVERTIEGIKRSCEYAGTKGVILALENHGGITAEADQLLKLVKAVDSPWFGVNLDTGNFRTADPYGDLEKLAPYAVNVQVKTEIQRKGEPKKEPADLAKLVEMLKKVRYSGYVVLEYEAAEDPFKAIPEHVKTLRHLIERPPVSTT